VRADAPLHFLEIAVVLSPVLGVLRLFADLALPDCHLAHGLRTHMVRVRELLVAVMLRGCCTTPLRHSSRRALSPLRLLLLLCGGGNGRRRKSASGKKKCKWLMRFAHVCSWCACKSADMEEADSS
jgi:hypothetical protein